MSDKLPSKSTSAQVQSFLDAVAAAPSQPRGDKRGRLLFAMDATASREQSWDRACHIQAEMFAETQGLGGLEVSLCYYRGFGKFTSTQWFSRSSSLSDLMSKVRCEGGLTQIEKVLAHAAKQAEGGAVNAVVFVGDCMEEEIDPLCHWAGRLGLLGVPVFMFHEGSDPIAAKAFREVARLSGGAYCSFDASSARQLRDLLSAVAVFVAGGRKALEEFGKRGGREVLRLTRQIAPRKP